jgi:predicted O-methyltransferase YrrM
MTPERWKYINAYVSELLGDTDPQLQSLMARAVEAGLPDIAVSPDVGRLLKILVSLTPGGLALELGTLAGYSGIWIARGLRPEGKLITIEYDPKHAEFAEGEFAAAGVGNKVEVVRGAALEVLPEIATRVGEGSVDFVFLDAVKSEYPDYFRAVRPLIAPGGVLVADNVLGTGAGWIDEGYGTDPFNRLVAADPEFETTITPQREGLLVARRL